MPLSHASAVVLASATSAVVAVLVTELLRRLEARSDSSSSGKRESGGRMTLRPKSIDEPQLSRFGSLSPASPGKGSVMRHTEDAILRALNVKLMERGRALKVREVVLDENGDPWRSAEENHLAKAPAKTKVIRIALTGGPCAGKSSALEHMIQAATQAGFDMITPPEIATLFFNSSYALPSPSSSGFAEQVFTFQANVLKLQLQLERCFSDLAGSSGRPTIVVFDRGLMDGRAFMTDEMWKRGLDGLNRELTGGRPAGSINEEYMLQRYDGVVHLVTAADGAAEHYKYGVVTDDSGNAVYRRETPAEAVDQDRKLRQAWAAHPKQVVVHNSSLYGFEAKVARATEAVLEIARSAHPSEALRAKEVVEARQKKA